MAIIKQFPKVKQPPSNVIGLGGGELVSLDFERTLLAFKKFIWSTEKTFNIKIDHALFNHLTPDRLTLKELNECITTCIRDIKVGILNCIDRNLDV